MFARVRHEGKNQREHQMLAPLGYWLRGARTSRIQGRRRRPQRRNEGKAVQLFIDSLLIYLHIYKLPSIRKDPRNICITEFVKLVS